MSGMVSIPKRDASYQPVFMAALPATSYGDQLALTEHVYPCADIAECLSPTVGARCTSQSLHIPKYRGVTPPDGGGAK